MKIRLSYSSSMYARARCKHCKSEPNLYFYILEKSPTLNFKTKKNPPNLISSFYLMADPKHFKSITHFSCYLGGQYKESPRFFHTHKNRFSNKKAKYTIAITCNCNKTIWYTPNEKKRNKADRYFTNAIKYII